DLKAELRRVGRRLQDLDRRERRAADSATWQHHADLLLANLHLVRPNAEAVEVTDWSTGQPLAIPLDPAKNGPQNAQALYERARRARKAADTAAEREALLTEQRKLERRLAEVAAATSAAEL